ncbi:MAG: hypothetical protein A3C07_00100 [Candidatus Sungbacteria bacterium RIFCSPHIGHO2_02_FULL_47_11]|uniref:VanZ-like domain-containing protein n=1 Tax=Candidatus Sungbacteria bacterium RIFCSPHIGHO2_02_FULL_47_11 TaxID=1802270 RepID=A0A1G2KP39_9BACT|nr:MAG: hypothetical protein A3C07_00100 [Candidatus Sungbacteria bacterium RIFCSPHIGHO2_02_FULL_47_11]
MSFRGIGAFFRKIDWIAFAYRAFWLFVWAGFVLVWGRILWTTAEFGSPEWMLDNYGHALAGIIIATQSNYEIFFFFPKASYHPIKRRMILWAVIPLIVFALASAWEVSEMIRDFAGGAVQAQKGGPDTTLDIIITVMGGCLGLALIYLHGRWKKRRDSEEEDEFSARVEAWREEGKELNQEIRTHQRLPIKKLQGRFIQIVKDFLSSEEEG